jgi:hypothetical protein
MSILQFQGQVSKSLGFARPSRYRVIISLQNLFAEPLIFSWFKYLGIADYRNSERLAFFCEKAEFPPKFFITDQGPYLGPPRLGIRSSSFYDTVQLRFYVGRDMVEKYLFDAWMYGIENPETHEQSFLTEYSTEIVIEQYDDLMEIPGLSAFPNLAAGIALGTGVGTQIAGYIEKGLAKVSTVIPYISEASVPFMNNTFTGIFETLTNFGLKATYKVRLYDAFPTTMYPMQLSYNMTDQFHRLDMQFTYRRWKLE